MDEFSQKHNLDDEDVYSPAGVDTLGVLSSTYPVVELGELVWIDMERVKRLIDQWTAQSQTGKITPPAWYDAYHFFDGTERTVNWILLLDALNFCFWAEKGQPRWTVEYHSTTLNGYLAEAAALTRAVEEQLPLWDAQYLSTMSENDLTHIFRGQQGIPLFEQRLYNVREVGRVLLERYDGQFIHAIEQAGYNAMKLALLLAREFSSFHDVALYHGKEVRFLKRAQICVADIYGAFGGKSWGALTNMDRLTAFADYKLPQVLRHVGVLEYAPSLAKQVDNQELIEAGTEEEVEIRAATVWACELLRQEMAQRGSLLTAAEIDLRLWFLGQHTHDMKPYHRTRTIFY